MNLNTDKFILKTALALLLLTVPVSAATLQEYRENISNLKKDISSLLSPNEDWDEEDLRNFEKEVLKKLPEIIPAKQKIEWQGATIETDNRWLAETFEKFKKSPPDSGERTKILIGIYERLDSIEQKINELENPVSAANRTKDENKQKLAEILRREEFLKPEEKEESFIQRAYRKVLEWLAKMFPKLNIPESAPAESSAFPFVLQILLYALVLGLIGFFVYKFAPFLVQRFRTRERRENRERVILGEKLAADETADTLFSQAELLAREGDLRGAIRKGYIALLCELSDRKLIGLKKHKTNRDYLRDVRKRRPLYQNLRGLTNNFERHWYGSETTQETDWEEFKDGYRKTVGGDG